MNRNSPSICPSVCLLQRKQIHRKFALKHADEHRRKDSAVDIYMYIWNDPYIYMYTCMSFIGYAKNRKKHYIIVFN